MAREGTAPSARERRRLNCVGVLATLAAVACGGTTRGNDTQSSGGKSSGGQSAGSSSDAGSSNSVGGAGTAGTPISAGAGGADPPGGAGGAMAGAAGVAGGAGAESCFPCVDAVTANLGDFGIGSWESSWFLTGCRARVGAMCATVPDTCPGQAAPFEEQGVRTVETFKIGGIEGQNYKVTFQFNAIAEAKIYEGGTRLDSEYVPAQPEVIIWDTFYRDGAPVASGYNVWKLTVYDQTGSEARHYYMNSFPTVGSWESHRTFRLSYKHSIVVVGGGKITHEVHDADCLAVDNCGNGNVPPESCPAPQSLPLEGNELVPPQYQDPADGMIKPTTELSAFNQDLSQPWHSQLGHLTITKVEPTADPVTTNYR